MLEKVKIVLINDLAYFVDNLIEPRNQVYNFW